MIALTLWPARSTAPAPAPAPTSAPARRTAPERAPIGALHAALDRLHHPHGRPPETPTRLTDHTPMALHALWALGAPAERLRSWAEAQAARWPIKAEPSDAAAGAWPAGHPDDWPALLGRGPYGRLRASLAAAVARDGLPAVLRRAAPMLVHGVAAAAFHGPIRVAHALQSGHAEELISALAYWAWRWQPLPPSGERADAPRLAVHDWLAALTARHDRGELSGWLISDRMAQASRSPAYQALADRLAVDDGTLPALRAWAAAQYARSGNFTLLHAVTGLRAVAVLQQACPALDLQAALPRAITAAWLSVAHPAAWPSVAHPTTGPALDPPRADPGADDRSVDWAALRQAAIAQDDDHVIKLVHAADEAVQQGVPGPWASAATRALRGATGVGASAARARRSAP